MAEQTRELIQPIEPGKTQETRLEQQAPGTQLHRQDSWWRSFLERIVTTAPNLEASKTYRKDITFTFPVKLPPGLHQVRVAAGIPVPPL